jgi:hypothetical protein
MAPRTINPDIRFAALCERAEDGCLHFVGKLDSGYGRFSLSHSQAVLAHRYAWEQVNGPIPDGLTVDHICHDPALCAGGKSCTHRRCVDVTHMILATRGDNARRRVHPTNGNDRKTHCKHGHPFSPENTGRNSTSGSRYCRTCMNERKRRQRAGQR